MCTATLEAASMVERAAAAPPTRRDRMAIPALTVASVISNIGNNLTMIAIPWFVLITTGSAARTGIVAASGTAALIMAGVIGGTWVDRIGPKRAAVISDIASGTTVAIVPTLYLLDVLQFWHLLVLMFLSALLDAPGWSARSTMIPPLAERSGTPLERANSIRELGIVIASVSGPLLAGILIAALSAANVLYLDAASFAISAAIIGVVIALPRVAQADDEQRAAGSSMFAESLEGARFIIRDRMIRTMVLIGIGANFLFAPLFAVVFPVFAKQVFDDPRALGILIASFGLGTMLGVVLYGAVGPRFPRYPSFVATIIISAAGMWIVPMSDLLFVCGIGGLVMGFGIGPVNIITTTVIQEMVPSHLMGRVFGTLTSASQMATPISLLACGAVIEWVGVRPVMWFVAAAFTALVIISATLPVFRGMERRPDNATAA